MEQGKKSAWWDNPLGLGAVGLALLVLGYLAIGFVPSLSLEESEDARHQEMFRSGAAQLEKKDPRAAAALRAEGSSFRPPPFLWPGRLAFLAGCVFVTVAGSRWYRLAQQPPAETETEVEEVNDQGEA